MNEYGSTIRVFLVVSFSILIAMFLTVLPLPDWAVWLRPRWVVMVVIFWSMVLPYRFGVGMAWLIGLILDLIQGTLLGEQALLLALLAYIVIKLQLRLQLVSLTQRTLIVFGLLLLYQVLIFLMQNILASMPFNWFYWLSPIMGALLWPWVYAVLKGYQRRCKIFDPATRGLMFSRE